MMMSRHLRNTLIMFAIWSVGAAFASASEPCTPGAPPAGAYACVKFSGKISGVGVHEKFLLSFARGGLHKAWLIPTTSDAMGTWRVRLMKFSRLSEYEQLNQQSHFHQLGQSDLSQIGPRQEFQFSGGGQGTYQYQVECEDYCKDLWGNPLPFDLIVQVP